MKKHASTVRITWLRAYISVVLVMSSLFFLSTVMVLREVECNAKQVDFDTANFIRNTLDDSWDRVFDFSLQIINNSSAKSFEHANGDEIFSSPSAYEFSLDFRNYILSNTMVEEFFLYYPTSDYVIGNRGVYSSEIYCAALYGVTREYDAATWTNLLFANRTPGYFTIRRGSQIDLYYRMAVSDLIGRIVVVKIDAVELGKMLEWISRDNDNSFLAMADESGAICAYSGNYEKFVEAESNRLRPIDTHQYLSTALPSSIGTLQYVTVTEKSAAFRLANTVFKVALITLLLAIVSGIVISLFLVRRAARPVEELAARLQLEGCNGNELALIGTQIDALIAENQTALSALARQQNMMVGRSFLNECLNPSIAGHRYVETIAAIYSLSFEGTLFSVLVRERAGTDCSDEIVDLIISLDDEEALVCWTQQQDLDVFLINYDEPLQGGSSVVEQLMEKLRAISSPETKIICSEPTTNPEQMRSIYLECLRQLHRTAMIGQSVESGKPIEPFQGQSTLNTFLRCLYDREYYNAQQLVEEVYTAYIAQADELERKCRQSYVLLHLLPLRDQVGDKLLFALDNAETQEEWSKYMDTVLLRAAQCQRGLDESFENDLAGRIRVFIDKHYDNPMLDLRMIADEHGVSQSYASRMFKRKYGIGTSYYINQVRITHAKELIRIGSQSIKSIAFQVGFSSDVQFIRVFKKFEAVTPGTFRDAAAE